MICPRCRTQHATSPGKPQRSGVGTQKQTTAPMSKGEDRMKLTSRETNHTIRTDTMQQPEYHQDQGQAGQPHPGQKNNKAPFLLSPPALAPQGLDPRGKGPAVCTQGQKATLSSSLPRLQGALWGLQSPTYCVPYMRTTELLTREHGHTFFKKVECTFI